MITTLLALLLAGVLSAATASWAGPDPSRRDSEPFARPNVILFLTDDQAWGDLGVHGNPHLETPQLDALARSSVELTRFYVSPVCAPTRASLMTGRWYLRTGVTSVEANASRLDPDEVTIAEVLREAGYATAVFGKWHLGDDAPHRPMDQGFEESIVHEGSGIYGRNSYFNPHLMHNGASERFEGYCQDIWIDQAIRFLEERKADGRPFFLYLPTNLVHVPLQAKERLVQPYFEQGIARDTARIYGMMASIDEGFGRLGAALRALGFEENTLLLFTSDNGPQGRHSAGRYMAGLRGVKGTVYENGIRVPFYARWPAGGIVGARALDRIAAHVDLLPTILDAVRLPAPASVRLDGTSLLPLLEGERSEADWPDRTLFFQWDARLTPEPFQAFAVVTQQFKLVQARGIDAHHAEIWAEYANVSAWNGAPGETITGAARYELFDLERDPGERQDLAAQDPERVEALKRRYEAWFRDVRLASGDL